MVGGRIIEVLRNGDRMRLWCMDSHGDECAVNAENHYGVQPGDQCWWQGQFVYWTPAKHSGAADIPIRKIGFSFDPAPEPSPQRRKGDLRCIEGRLFRHDPQWDDPDLETDIGQCPDCSGDGCDDEPVSKPGRSEYWLKGLRR